MPPRHFAASNVILITSSDEPSTLSIDRGHVAECQFAAITDSTECCCANVSVLKLDGGAVKADIASTSCWTCVAARVEPSLSSK